MIEFGVKLAKYRMLLFEYTLTQPPRWAHRELTQCGWYLPAPLVNIGRSS
jgi:hypothetical protein